MKRSKDLKIIYGTIALISKNALTYFTDWPKAKRDDRHSQFDLILAGNKADKRVYSEGRKNIMA
jgi:hypothetical protein